ncbi:hypothetical protein M8J77_000965 [Diaphorina citri]|nr:hypothetical protein M8J77_000965 [Diaphorina citri]
MFSSTSSTQNSTLVTPTAADHVYRVDSEVLESVSDLILNPPAVEKYKTLKDRLIEHFSGSETQRFQHLLSAQEFGDEKPSELLQHMIDLCPSLDAKFLKTLWLQQLLKK